MKKGQKNKIKKDKSKIKKVKRTNKKLMAKKFNKWMHLKLSK
jgi:hypothetical protein